MPMEWLLSFLAAASVFFAAVGACPALRPATVPVASSPEPKRGVRHWTGSLLADIGKNRWASRMVRLETLRRRLELAGARRELEMAVGAEVAVALVAGLTAVPFGLVFPPAFVLSPAVTLAAARGFELVVARRAHRRQERMAAGVPDLVELLVATTDAGLSPGMALARTADLVHGPLAEELRWVVSEVELGVPWQGAMDRMVARTEVSSLRALAAALSRSQQLGTVLGSTLRQVAEELRSERRARAEETARKAPIKMLFPLVFLILPAFLLLTVGPVVLATVKSLR